MSSSARTAPTQKVDLSNILNENVRAAASASRQTRAKVEASSSAFADIQTNGFYKIMFDESLSPEEKKAAVEKAMIFEGTKAEVRQRVKEFQQFQEYLQHVREEMAQEIIRLTDTEAFSELKRVYDDLNNSLVDFDDKMRPLTEIIDALFELRTNGQTFDAFREIQEDRKAEEDYRRRRSEFSNEFDSLNAEVAKLQRENSALAEKKGFFGFGGITEAARMEIARNEARIREARARQEAIRNDVKTIDVEERTRKETQGEFAAQKEKLRELLDISTDGHKERQRELVDAALNFVNTAKTRVGAVRNHLGQMDVQVDNLFETNSRMTNMYAILNDALAGATTQNQTLREQFATEGEGESMIAKMTREERRMEIEEHIGVLSSATVDTMDTFADLTGQSIRVRNMREANRAQMEKARRMHSTGIAGVADRLSVVLQAVSSAALGESSAMAKDTLARMADSTNSIAQKESIRIAMGATEINADLDKALADLAAYGEVQRAATSITRDAVTEMREKLDELQSLARDVQGDLQEAIAVQADVAAGGIASKAEPAKKGPTGFTFGG